VSSTVPLTVTACQLFAGSSLPLATRPLPLQPAQLPTITGASDAIATPFGDFIRSELCFPASAVGFHMIMICRSCCCMLLLLMFFLSFLVQPFDFFSRQQVFPDKRQRQTVLRASTAESPTYIHSFRKFKIFLTAPACPLHILYPVPRKLCALRIVRAAHNSSLWFFFRALLH
jgi:hypothetical protein